VGIKKKLYDMKISSITLLALLFSTLGCSSVQYAVVPSNPITDFHQSTTNLRYIETIVLPFDNREVVMYSEIMTQVSSKYPHKIIIDNVRYQYVVTDYLFGLVKIKRIREVVVDVYRSSI